MARTSHSISSFINKIVESNFSAGSFFKSLGDIDYGLSVRARTMTRDVINGEMINEALPQRGLPWGEEALYHELAS